ncbi:uncharacterized protein BDZ99DRAFT_466286 [Mytilinidion resinicola]|uniref:Aminoglycoside phosphotransferase domain-containing protein n=1 Tax=Mytilinidion resinicola TaxID=574789 RepID=A0A6A6YAZ5_9PEZI|nr:uncharacterized protein BDZ99DRAFT_466286 [Mytilinidion resinicola]KAF2805991.1 hypothetical protein BDZ99DRAFT_466286 [Mytilinidion resinicola]
MATITKPCPSTNWTSYDAWGYDGMKERLERFMGSIDKSALLEHVEQVTGKAATMSDPFSASQFWCCFEFILSDESLIIARVRLPRHPESNDDVNEESELYAIECEVATMRFVQGKATSVPSPCLYAYAGPGSQQAAKVGACFMLIEGFYGNTLQDVKFDICDLPIQTQEHILTQWTSIQAELASFSFPTIGSIAHFAQDTGPTIGKLATAVAEGLQTAGPFLSSHDYFKAVGDAKHLQACKNYEADADDDDDDDDDADIFTVLGPFIFRDIVQRTDLFKGPGNTGPFHFNHMDMGTQNILVDDAFNFLAIIDWEFAQSVPAEVNHYPMPFPLISSDAEIEHILSNPDSVTYRNVQRHVKAREIYQRSFSAAEQALAGKGRPLQSSIAKALDGPASRVYAALGKIAIFDGMGEELTREMIRLAFGRTGEEADEYVEKMKMKIKES